MMEIVAASVKRLWWFTACPREISRGVTEASARGERLDRGGPGRRAGVKRQVRISKAKENRPFGHSQRVRVIGGDLNRKKISSTDSSSILLKILQGKRYKPQESAVILEL